MASVPDLHDAEIVGLAHDRAAGVLSLSIRPTRGPAASLRFTELVIRACLCLSPDPLPPSGAVEKAVDSLTPLPGRGLG